MLSIRNKCVTHYLFKGEYFSQRKLRLLLSRSQDAGLSSFEVFDDVGVVARDS